MAETQNPQPVIDEHRLPVGTVATVEGRVAVLIGTDGGPVRWQWLNGDWTAIPFGPIAAHGHVLDLPAEPTDT